MTIWTPGILRSLGRHGRASRCSRPPGTASSTVVPAKERRHWRSNILLSWLHSDWYLLPTPLSLPRDTFTNARPEEDRRYLKTARALLWVGAGGWVGPHLARQGRSSWSPVLLGLCYAALGYFILTLLYINLLNNVGYFKFDKILITISIFI